MKKKEIFTASNFLSFLRLLLAVPIWILMDNFDQDAARYAVAGLGIFASITDVLDGYLARKLNQVTEAGKIIDPLADKILIGIVVLKLYLIGEMPPLYFWLVIGRDLLIMAGGLIIAKKIGWVIPSNLLGKLAVAVISFVLLFIILNIARESIYFAVLYYLSIVLIIASFGNYLYNALNKLKNSHG